MPAADRVDRAGPGRRPPAVGRTRRGVRAVGTCLLVVVVFAGTAATALSSRLPVEVLGSPVAVLAVALVVTVAVAAWGTRRLPLALAAIGGWLLVLAWPAVLVASYRTATQVRSRTRLLGHGAVAAVFVGSVVIAATRDRQPSDRLADAMTVTLLLVVLPMGLGRVVAARRAATATRGGGSAGTGKAPADGPAGTARRLRRVNRVVDAAVPWLLGLGCAMLVPLAADLPDIEPGSDTAATWRLIAVYATVVLLVAAIVVVRSTRWPLYGVGLVAFGVSGFWVPPVIASYYTATGERRRAGLVGYCVCATAVVGGRWAWVSAQHGGADIGFSIMAPVMLVGLPFLVGSWESARREVAAYQAEQVVRLERERAAQVTTARAQERTRIAREMHDVVAHRVTLMVLHAGALEVGAGDQRTREAAAVIRATGREALSDLRDVLGVLRNDGTAAEDQSRLAPQPTLADLDHLIERARTAGLPVRRTGSPTAQSPPAGAPLNAERTVFRVVQEALTNVIKHADAAETTVEVRHRPDRVEVSVINAAPERPDCGPCLPGSGLGLVGLRERVELLGGEFWAGLRADGGFTVRASIPYGGTGPAASLGTTA